MPKLTWPSGTVSIIILPAGDDGEKLLEIAKQWTASWLISPAFWIVESQIPEMTEDALNQIDTIPKVRAFVLGRDASGNPDSREVDLFFALGSQVFQLVRLIAARTKQPKEELSRTNAKVQILAKILDAAKPQLKIGSSVGDVGTRVAKVNLIFSQSGQSCVVPKSVIQNDWDANVIAAPEDRTTPGSIDAFVRSDNRNFGFILAHIATAGGLWAGLPKSTFEMGQIHQAVDKARMQRVFVRAVATDTLSGDLAKWALNRAASPDNESALGVVSGREVGAVAPGKVKQKAEDLLDYMLKGVEGENFLYQSLPDDVWRSESRTTLFARLATRAKDFIEGLVYIPKWSLEMITQRIDQDIHEEIPRDYLPSRLDPRFDLIEADEIINQPRPKVKQTGPNLWKHVREAISASLDSPPGIPVPELLCGENGERLIFGDTRMVLPDPSDSWQELELSEKAAVHLDLVGWLDIKGVQESRAKLDKKKSELAPGMDEVLEEMKETREELTRALEEEVSANANLELAEFELAEDLLLAQQMRQEHTHGMPIEIVGPSRPIPDGSELQSGEGKPDSEIEIADPNEQDGYAATEE